MTNHQPPSNLIFDQPPASYKRCEDLDELLKLNQENITNPNRLISKLIAPSFEVFLDRFITQDPLMLKMKDEVERIVRLPYNKNAPVLITGPTGTGKEIIARAFKREGYYGEGPNRKPIPFLARNCAGFPRELITSLLFGHMKGTFTGAVNDQAGLFESARNGVVFLDEIGELPLEAQAILLRVLQDRTVTRLGAHDDIPINCRIITATKRDLRLMVDTNLFREDLFARLMAFEINITGLDKRPLDIPLIAAQGYDLEGNLLNYTSSIPEHVMPDIYRYNVRAIQAFVQRIRTYGRY